MNDQNDFRFSVEIDWPTTPSSDPWQCFGDELTTLYGKPGKYYSGKNWNWEISRQDYNRIVILFKEESMMMMWRIKAADSIQNMKVLQNV